VYRIMDRSRRGQLLFNVRREAGFVRVRAAAQLSLVARNRSTRASIIYPTHNTGARNGRVRNNRPNEFPDRDKG